jgi:hypothetical protein
MAYGEIKVDTITFTDGGIDKSVSISGLVQNPTFSGNITVTGTISGNTLQGQTVSGVTVTGTTAQFASGTFTSLTGTTLQGTTATYTTGSFTSLTGTTTTGTTATFTTGVFSSSISGAVVTATSGVIASGTAANPSLSILGDSNTGIYSPGADQVAISTNGTGRLFVDANGNVGIRTAPFLASLSIGNQSTFALAIQNPSAQTSYIYFTRSSNSTDGRAWIEANAEPTGFMAFGAGGSERMRLDSTGRLGLGTSSPSSTLDVSGLVSSGYAARIVNIGNSVNSLGLFIQAGLNNGFGDNKQVSFNYGGTEAGFISNNLTTLTLAGVGGLKLKTNSLDRVTVTSAGLVGIGTTAADQALSVQGLISTKAPDGSTRGLVGSPPWDTSYFAVQNGTLAQSAANAALYQNTVGITTLNSASGYPIVFAVGQGERARIDSSGRLLVGTSTGYTFTTASNTGISQTQFVGVGNDETGSKAIVLCNQGGTSRGPSLILAKNRSGSTALGTVSNNDNLGEVSFQGSAASAFVRAASIAVYQDGGTPSSTSMAGRLVFSTTADGASSPTERMRITSAGVLQVADAGNITVGTTTGTKIGTATTQKLGFYNATPVVQPAAVADATTAVDVITQLNDLLAKLRTLGIIAT